MPFIPLTQRRSSANDTRYPWMVIVPDEEDDDEEEFVVLPDDIGESFEALGSWVEGSEEHSTPSHSVSALPLSADSPEWYPDAVLLAGSGSPLGDLSVVSPKGYAVPTPHQPQHTLRVRSFEHLDHGNPDEAMAYEHLLPRERYLRLRTGLNKIEAYHERFNRPDDQYRETLSLVALSDWADAFRFCLCGVKNASGWSQPCRLPNLCPSCSYWQRKKTSLLAYLTNFRRTSWYFVTISYVVHLGDGILDEEIVRVCWRAAVDALRAHQDAGFSRGAMSRLEMHLERFLPLQYLAHLHAIVDADRIDQPFLADRVFAYRHPGTAERITFPVSICDRPLRSEKGFVNSLSYVGKAINVATAYRAAWPRAEEDGRRLVPALNEEVDEFLNAFSVFTADTHQVRYTGTMHVGSRDSLRVPRKKHAAQQELVDSTLEDCVLDPCADDDTETTNSFEPPIR